MARDAPRARARARGRRSRGSRTRRAFALGGLATHLARLPHWGTSILEQRRATTSADERPARPRPRDASPRCSRRSTATSREVRRGARRHDRCRARWRRGRSTRRTQLVMSMPRRRARSRFLLHHVIHHRGQLTVYLRLQDVPLPPLYGPDGRRADVSRRAGARGWRPSPSRVVATANSGGYRYGVSDQAFYVPAIAQGASTRRCFRATRRCSTPQMRCLARRRSAGGACRASPASTCPRSSSRSTSLTLVGAVRGGGGCFARAARRSRGGPSRRFLLLLTLRHRIAKTGANSLEGYMHPRMLAFALGVRGAAPRRCARAAGPARRGRSSPRRSCIRRPRSGSAWSSGVGDRGRRDRRWRRALVGAGGVAAVVAVLGAARPVRSPAGCTMMDADWLAVLAEKDYLFPAEWPAYAWVAQPRATRRHRC